MTEIQIFSKTSMQTATSVHLTLLGTWTTVQPICPHNVNYINRTTKWSMSARGVFNCIQGCLKINAECWPMDFEPIPTRGPYLVLHVDTWLCTIPNDSEDAWNSPSDKHVICHVAQRPCCHWGLVPQVCTQSGYLLSLNKYSLTASSVCSLLVTFYLLKNELI